MFVPGKPLQPSLMFVGEAGSLPYSGTPERFSKIFKTFAPGYPTVGTRWRQPLPGLRREPVQSFRPALRREVQHPEVDGGEGQQGGLGQVEQVLSETRGGKKEFA
jgi:hypothetical protein